MERAQDVRKSISACTEHTLSDPYRMSQRPSPEQITWRALRAFYRMDQDDRPRAALAYLEEALAADPLCYEALVRAGELYCFEWDSLGLLSESEGCQAALHYFDRAINSRPEHAEAYAEKVKPLNWLGRFDAALECAQLGFLRLDHRPTTDEFPEVVQNLGESLYAGKAEALVGLSRHAEARETLASGLARYPESSYLTHYASRLLPPL